MYTSWILQSMIMTLALILPVLSGRAELCPPMDEVFRIGGDVVISNVFEFAGEAQGIAGDFAYSLTGAKLASGLVPSGGSSRVAMIDNGFDLSAISRDRLHSQSPLQFEKSEKHGTGTTNVLLEASSQAELGGLIQYEQMLDVQSFSKTIDQLVQNDVRTVNVSYSMGNFSEIRQSLQAMCNAGITVVASVGNDGNAKIAENNSLPCIINVGSVSAHGTLDAYSQSGSRLDILAPVGNHLAVKNSTGGRVLESGTSFAAPQVAAAIADVHAILGGNWENKISRDEIRLLISKTSIQTINGPMLNHYKLLRVAQRLKSGWPSNREAILSDQAGEGIYDFSREAKNLLASASSVESLQQIHFLDSEGASGKEAATRLSKMSSLGETQNFYRSLVTDPMEYLYELKSSSDPDVRASANRSLLELEEGEQVAVMAKLLNSPNPEIYQESLAMMVDQELVYAPNISLSVITQLEARIEALSNLENSDTSELAQQALAQIRESREFRDLLLQSRDRQAQLLQLWQKFSAREGRFGMQVALRFAKLPEFQERAQQKLNQLVVEQNLSEKDYERIWVRSNDAESHQLLLQSLQTNQVAENLGPHYQRYQLAFLVRPYILGSFVRRSMFSASNSEQRAALDQSLQELVEVYGESGDLESLKRRLRELASRQDIDSEVSKAASEALELLPS